MPDVTFDDQYDRLLAALDQAVLLLRRYSKDFWADWLETDRVKIAKGDSYALDHLLQAFGGMGSLNDLIIHPVNGDVIEDSDVPAANEELTSLREEIWTTAKAMRREINAQ